MKIIVFEDHGYNDFYPISLTRPLWDIRSGIFTGWQRYALLYKDFFPQDMYFYTRDHIGTIARIRYPDLTINTELEISKGEEIILLNSRLIYPSIHNMDANTIYLKDGNLLAARMKSQGVIKILNNEDVFKVLNLQLKNLEYNDSITLTTIWNLITINSDIIKRDFELLRLHGAGRKNDFELIEKQNVTILGDYNQLIIGNDAVIEPYVVIDCTKGPVYLGEHSNIKSFTRIEGPCAISEGSIILQAKIRGGCSIGPFCRVGGEVEESIFQGFSNKYHDGFIGHSYIGEWVNLGALTTNSDLKNNYTNVKIIIGNEKINTGLLKVGCFIGDFTMTSIGTLIDTGTVMGPGCMIIHNGQITPKFIPPFSWYIEGKIVELPSLEKFFATCRTMMSRRNKEFTEYNRRYLEHIFDITKNFREGLPRWNVQKYGLN